MSRYLPAVSVTVLLSFCLCTTLKAQSESTPFSDFAKHLPDSQTEIFAVHNVAGHVESILRNKALARSLEDGKMADAMALTGTYVDMDDAIDWLAENRHYFPQTTAISLPSDSYVALVDVFQLMMLLNIAQVDTDQVDAKELVRLENDFKKVVSDFKLPTMTLWIQWPETQTTETFYEQFMQVVAIAGLSTNLKFTQEEGSFLLSGSIADIDQNELINSVLASMGIADKSGEISKAIRNIKILVRCEQLGKGMRISIGSDPKNKKITPLALPNIKDGSDEIAYGQWNSEKLLKAANRFEKDMDSWADTDLVKQFRANDLEDVWGSMTRFTEEIKLVSDKGRMRVWAVENQVRARTLSQGISEAESLTGQKILSLVPADIESYYVDSGLNLGELVFGVIENAEERLAAESLKLELKGNLQNNQRLEDFILNYYKHFGPFRALLMNELAVIDSNPIAIVMDTKGSFKSSRLELETDNLVRMAAIASCENPEQFQKKSMEAYEKLVAGVLSFNGLELPDDTMLFQDGTLSNGTRTTVFSLEWLNKLELLQPDFKADFQLHAFTYQGHVIFSTSSNFSELLLASGKESLKLPKPENQNSITSHGHFKGKTIGNMYAALFNVFLPLFIEMPRGTPLGQGEIGDAISEVGDLMNHVQWTTEQNGENSDVTFVIDFKNE